MCDYRGRMSMPFGFGLPDPNQPGGAPFDMSSLGAALQQFGRMLQDAGPDTGPVNWTTVRDVARSTLSQVGDPSVNDSERKAVVDAVALADLWLNEATTLPAIGGAPAAWSRSEWLEATIPMWQHYVQPVAEQMQSMLPSGTADLATMSPEDLQAQMPEQLRAMLPDTMPAEFAAMLQPMLGMMRQLSVVSFSMQLGQSLAALAQEVVSLGDIGIPLAERAQCALVIGNAQALGEGLTVPREDVLLYLALRESAHQRLFAHVPWLRARMVGAIEEYAKGVRVDPERLREATEGADLSDPQAMQQLMASGLLQPQDTEEQRAALARLETLLALVEGWVDDVVASATEGRLPNAAALAETMRRRRASGGPAERTFATLVGLELRPRALREAATVFAAVRHSGGLEGRDALWGHPDLLPDAEDLTDPLGFVERSTIELPPFDVE